RSVTGSAVNTPTAASFDGPLSSSSYTAVTAYRYSPQASSRSSKYTTAAGSLGSAIGAPGNGSDPDARERRGRRGGVLASRGGGRSEALGRGAVRAPGARVGG